MKGQKIKILIYINRNSIEVCLNVYLRDYDVMVDIAL